ncbi:MAG: beta-propeller fold lactonase family protein, partial [Candidatus Korobacteraceae bacterium]
MKRREFLVVTAAVPMAGAFAFAEAQQKRISGRSVFYAAVGEEVMQYDLDATGAALIRRASVTVPANVQEAWPHPSGKYLYVTWSNGGASYAAVNGAVPKGDKFGVSAFRIDPASGALSPHGTPAALPVRSVFVTTDIDGTHLISAFNEPSSLAVHRIMPDGTLGAEVKSKAPLDC